VSQESGSTGAVTETSDVVALFNSNSFVSASDQLSSGEMVTVWVNNNDDAYIYGHAKDYRPGYPDAFTFKIPAATPTNNISRLIVSPLSDSTFAITQVVIDAKISSSFVNYYVLSNCADSIITPNENCQPSEEGCINCMCLESAGWYSTGDGVTCRTCKSGHYFWCLILIIITACADGIIAGNETCFNINDANCVDCMCIDKLEWSTERKLWLRIGETSKGFLMRCLVQMCVVPAPASNGALAPGGQPGSPVPFNNNLIAAIVCVPVAVGAAIFFGVFFGRRNAKKKQQGKDDEDIKDDLPLKPLASGKVNLKACQEQILITFAVLLGRSFARQNKR
jgi:hypothetical protein